MTKDVAPSTEGRRRPPDSSGERDLGRPLIHFTPPTGWVNDPVGLTFHNGEYHLFMQHIPHSVDWNVSVGWGHATSADLLHWTPRAVALSPGEGDDGVWSGCVVLNGNDPPTARIVYTSVTADDVQVGRIRVADAIDDRWVRWRKGPIVVAPRRQIGVAAFRDPFLFLDGDQWRMVVGGGLDDGTAVAWTYTSTNLRDWEEDGELARRPADADDGVPTGTVWECPQLFPLAGRWVLVVAASVPGAGEYTAYAVGDLVDGRFTAERWHRLTYGPSYYAPSTFVDREGHRGLIHWLRGIRDPAGTWAGAISVPHLLSLDGDRLVARPHVTMVAESIATATDSPSVNPPETAWVEWHPSPTGGTLRFYETNGSVLLELESTAHGLVARTPSACWELPSAAAVVGVLLDRLVVEVFTPDGILAVPIAATKPSAPASGSRLRLSTADGHALWCPAG